MYIQGKNGEVVTLSEHIPDRNVLALEEEVYYICMPVKYTNFTNTKLFYNYKCMAYKYKMSSMIIESAFSM